MYFYNTYQQKVYTWCFIILSGAIIWTFFFRDWTDAGASALLLAKLDHKGADDTEVAKIEGLLQKFSTEYHQPVDTIATYTAFAHTVEKFMGNSRHCLAILQAIDKIKEGNKSKYVDVVKIYLSRDSVKFDAISKQRQDN
jgi:hypothetical protein